MRNKKPYEIRFHSMLAMEGCLICSSQAQIHHLKAPKDLYQFLVLPLCEGHHMGFLDVSKLAFHKAKTTWRETYGHESTLYFRMREQLQEVGKWPQLIEDDLIAWLNSYHADKIYSEQFTCNI